MTHDKNLGCFSSARTCGGLQVRVRVVEGGQRGFLPRQEALPVLRVRAQLLRLVEGGVQRLRAELPRGLLVLLGRGEAAGQRRHERGGERHALRESLRESLRQAGAEAALQAGQRRVRVRARGEGGLQSRGRRRRRRGLEHHRPVRHEHRVPGVDEVSRAGLRGPPDQRVDAEGGGASEWPLHHHEGGGAERRAHMNDRRSSVGGRGRGWRRGGSHRLSAGAHRSGSPLRRARSIQRGKFQKHQRLAPWHVRVSAWLQSGRVLGARLHLASSASLPACQVRTERRFLGPARRASGNCFGFKLRSPTFNCAEVSAGEPPPLTRDWRAQYDEAGGGRTGGGG